VLQLFQVALQLLAVRVVAMSSLSTRALALLSQPDEQERSEAALSLRRWSRRCGEHRVMQLVQVPLHYLSVRQAALGTSRLYSRCRRVVSRLGKQQWICPDILLLPRDCPRVDRPAVQFVPGSTLPPMVRPVEEGPLCLAPLLLSQLGRQKLSVSALLLCRRVRVRGESPAAQLVRVALLYRPVRLSADRRQRTWSSSLRQR
jgi:hypothetical protein